MGDHLFRIILAALASLSIAAPSALAHPHVWITMKSEVVFAPDGSATGVRHHWTFDDMFSVFVTQGIDAKKKGEFTREELAPLAKVNVESLKDFDYFTFAKANGSKTEFNEPINYFLTFDAKEIALTLHFTLPFKAPITAKDFAVEIYDPSYFVDFSFVGNEPAALTGAPAACKLTVRRPQQMDAALASRLGQLPADTQLDPSQYLGSQFANTLAVKCS
jgi:ABC-type uncharacterized transport system substrate-binding protein